MPIPPYGSAQNLIGTPGYYANQHVATPEETIQFYVDQKKKDFADYMAQNPKADRAKLQAQLDQDIAALQKPREVGSVGKGGGGVVWRPNAAGGKDFYQDPNSWLSRANYNPNYDPMHFGDTRNNTPWLPTQLAPGTTNAFDTATKAPVQPTWNANPDPNNPNLVVEPPMSWFDANRPKNSPPNINTQPLQQAYAANNAITTPTAPTASPQITLPSIYQQNNNSIPGTTPPTPNGIKMPDFKKPLGAFNSGSNWTDFLTVAHNRYNR